MYWSHKCLLRNQIPRNPSIAVRTAIICVCSATSRAVCRIVSRGKVSSRASDFGGLEVFGQASIGNTDPYGVYKALLASLSMYNQ